RLLPLLDPYGEHRRLPTRPSPLRPHPGRRRRIAARVVRSPQDNDSLQPPGGTLGSTAYKGGAVIQEFKEFIAKGNIVQLAVAFVMGVTFASVVTTFTERIINPIIALILPGIDNLDAIGTFA